MINLKKILWIKKSFLSLPTWKHHDMKNIFKLYLLTFFILSDFVVFAQPGSDDGSGGLEGDDPPAAPINSKLILLLILGLVFAFIQIRKYKKVS